MKLTTFRRRFCLLALSLLVTTAISAYNDPAADEEAWLQSVQESWAEEDEAFKTSPTSPLAGVSRFEIEQTGRVYFFKKDDKLDWLPEEASQSLFSLVNNEGQWQWSALGEDVQLNRDDEELPPGSSLQSGDQLKAGRLTISFYPSKEAVTVLVFDPDTQRLKNFRTLERYEANPKFALMATIEKYETPQELEMITARQQFKKQYRYARLLFEIDGQSLELIAFKSALEGEGSEILFIPFADKTSGRDTYGGGRYLIVEEPREGDSVFIDFNLVTNPLCSYADIYNCILPPHENRLRVSILAGVKKYH